MNNYVYVRSEPSLFTVGFYAPNGMFHPDSDYNVKEEAAQRVAFLNGCPVFNSWTPTVKNLNALPYPIRTYIENLETNADPPSMVRENVLLRDTIKALEKKSTVTRTEIENAVGDTSEEYVGGVIELFESLGFTVRRAE